VPRLATTIPVDVVNPLISGVLNQLTDTCTLVDPRVACPEGSDSFLSQLF
jgi:hypothetical protein